MARVLLRLLLVTLTAFLCVPGTQGGAGVRGVHPDKSTFYRSGRDFTCLDGSATIPFSLVNDDYCDCQDGSDEPGTSACANGVFYCRNKGHKPQNLLASRVDDGICDCCDGADEHDSGVDCPNVCEEVGAAARQEQVKQMRLQAEGYKKREEYERQGAEERREAEEKLASLEAEVESLRPEVETLRAAKEAAEEPERLAKEEHRKRWEEEVEERKAARLRAEAQAGFDELDTDSNGFVCAQELQQRVELDNDGDGEVSRAEALEYLDNEEKVDFETFFERVWGVVSDKCQFQQPEVVEGEREGLGGDVKEQDREGEGEEGEEEEEEDYDYEDEDDVTPKDNEKMPDYDEATKELMAVADKAREEFRNVENRKRDLESEIRDLKKYLEMTFGERNEFAPLYEKCYEFTDREYTYKMCAFQKVSQKGKHGGRETSLGTWGSWAGPSGSRYTVMKYDNGEKCWNGPNRSATVTLTCGTEDAIVDASEPNRCEYAMVFSTPTVCEAPPPGHTFTHEEL